MTADKNNGSQYPFLLNILVLIWYLIAITFTIGVLFLVAGWAGNQL